jgi:hypothetical protein
MADDLHRLVRSTFASDARSQRDTTAAFEHAVDMVLRHKPLLSEEEARRAVATMIATEPAAAG